MDELIFIKHVLKDKQVRVDVQLLQFLRLLVVYLFLIIERYSAAH